MFGNYFEKILYVLKKVPNKNISIIEDSIQLKKILYKNEEIINELSSLQYGGLFKKYMLEQSMHGGLLEKEFEQIQQGIKDLDPSKYKDTIEQLLKIINDINLLLQYHSLGITSNGINELKEQMENIKKELQKRIDEI